ncbi:tRNA-dihydrouridine synthase [Crenobacter sp. SG2305]|uniref:tRNA dihydrouridine synthase n=1 Tax=Crenobacter oryzisoli TaxID=3056844 RepID=UPI0025AB1A4D|nr:tRNA-dihydrouridine synthase [Crenobacter sp. SG2305]MDN0081941.1 tRNA-dihydrouridine synthase [Crenobacter sp. SG2305]
MKVVLAPMEGLVDDVMRDILTRLGGVDLCVSEFIRVTSTLLPVKMFRRMVPELERGAQTNAGTPVRVQLLGSDPACMADNAARAAELGAPAVDLNFGCPAPTVNRHRGGAVLLDEPELIHAIVAAVRASVPRHIPVTAKMRLGYSDKSPAFDCARAIEAAGAAELTVHARTKVEGYRPPAHWDWLARIRETVSLPLTANGEVWSLADYHGIRDVSGCDTVMIGRGLVAMPDLGRQIRAANLGKPVAPMNWAELMPWIVDFYRQCYAKAPDNKYPVARLKQWLGLMKRTYPEAEQTFAMIKTETDAARLGERLQLLAV